MARKGAMMSAARLKLNLKKATLSSICLLRIARPASSSEWWQGSFFQHSASDQISTQTDVTCQQVDSLVTYGETDVSLWEESCGITKVTKLKGLDAVILDQTCSGEGEDQGNKREILLRMDNARIAVFPPNRVLTRCTPESSGKSDRLPQQ